MSETIIKVEDLSKRFVISHEKSERYTALRDVVARKVKNVLTVGTSKNNEPSREEFWALKDLTFDIKQGDRLGIIGRNGAGKSTLLKILSRITEPTTGRVTINGRVASLLEVGTGFHPELTGRENIFLNGAILGMSRAEIRSKFDEIVAFAEVEKFLDTPVKRYSSGMYVRLAFSVAAHLEPEILIVDEVLAVGDSQFQKKCLGKMQDVSNNDGRTVLFVSHNMSTLKSLCSTILYLNQGRMMVLGGVEETIKEYLNENKSMVETGAIPRNFHRKYQTGQAFFDSLIITSLEGDPKREFSFGQEIKIELEIEVLREIENGVINIIISTSGGEGIGLVADNQKNIYQPKNYKIGKHRLQIVITAKFLPSNYFVSAFIAHYHNGMPIDWVENVNSFTVSGVGLSKGSDYPWGVVHGYVEPASSWSYQCMGSK
jgi:lipopolysaccharide transport system ATP-binding protein